MHLQGLSVVSVVIAAPPPDTHTSQLTDLFFPPVTVGSAVLAQTGSPGPVPAPPVSRFPHL